MRFDMNELTPSQRYKLLTGVVVPRPIAFVTSLDAHGVVNAAPFSYFNIMGTDPPVLVFGPGDRADGRPKDTPGNIRATGEFVVNLVDETIAERMNVCAIDFPTGVSELEAAGLTTEPSVVVAAPRIAESPVGMECREVTTLGIGRTRVVLGRVLHLTIRDELVDLEHLYVRTEQARLVGRLHGRGWYVRTSDRFQMKRMSYQMWLEAGGKVAK